MRTRRAVWLFATAAIAGVALIAYVALHRPAPRQTPSSRQDATTAPAAIKGIPPDAIVVETTHYRIHATASRDHAIAVGDALEALHAAYTELFPIPDDPGKLAVVLYRDRAEFKRNNRSSPWAEAFYLDPACYAYFDADARNPYHWALHEAVHQLARKGSGFRRNRWIDEGLASYFSASERVDGRLRPGMVDQTAYPVWWLRDPTTVRDMPIPLETLLTGKDGPDVDTHFNQYYLSTWSLTHFLLHRDEGRHAGAYRDFLQAGADRPAFERHIGPIKTIEPEWKAYFRAQVAATSNSTD